MLDEAEVAQPWHKVERVGLVDVKEDFVIAMNALSHLWVLIVESGGSRDYK